MIVTSRITVWLVSGSTLTAALFSKNSKLVGRWAGLEDTHHLKGLWYDSHIWDYGIVGEW